MSTPEHLESNEIYIKNLLEYRSATLIVYTKQLYKNHLKLEKSGIVFTTPTKQVLAVLKKVLGEEYNNLESEVQSINLGGLTADHGNNIECFVRLIENIWKTHADYSITDHIQVCQVLDNIFRAEHPFLNSLVVKNREYTQVHRKKIVMMSIIVNYCTPCANQEKKPQPVPEPDVDQEQESDPGPEPNLENPKYP